MSNSPLVVYTKLSPNCTSPRNMDIDMVAIHCMAGNLSVETCGNMFADPERDASSNYGIGSDGRIAMYVEECNRSWCTSSGKVDHRAITIEVANCSGAPDWKVSDKAYDALIDLLVDICQRNPKIGTLKWAADKNLFGQTSLQNMAVHRWFANKSCPGNYLFNKHYEIAKAVNDRLTKAEDVMDQKNFNELLKAGYLSVNPLYGDISDIPEYWRPAIQELIDMNIINGGTPNDVNPNDVNLTLETVKAIVVMKSYIDIKLKGVMSNGTESN